MYSYEQKKFIPTELDTFEPESTSQKQSRWTFFESLPPSYQKKVGHWIMNAKTDETKDRRLKLGSSQFTAKQGSRDSD